MPGTHASRPNNHPIGTRHGKFYLVGIAILSLLAAGGIWADWWYGLPDEITPRYVGGQRCATCHADQVAQWTGSHHDHAMDEANEQTVLGDFNDAELEHWGVRSRMFRRDGAYWVHTEGPDGAMADFRVRYVFGVEPLQQYLVEFDRPDNLPSDAIARMQVLPVCWNTEKREWFYLSPPDVQEKLAPDDPLHWTGSAQTWNHMCAECHSTNLQKGYDVASRTYHTTFSDIDVNCEACHGPGSVHIELAEATSLFWDRKHHYGLSKIKGRPATAEIEVCAPCHSRRSVMVPDAHPGAPYHDHYVNELIRPGTYYPDGQILDEVYVYGSFLQSKMYKKGIACSDCHDPHTTRVKHTDNRLCTSCHAHPAGKYDVVTHHRHYPGQAGSKCVDCHMPATPFMEVDLRRDHSLRVPRPDLSMKLGTPNACTGCHLKLENVPESSRSVLTHYSKWLEQARNGDQAVQNEIDRANAWCAEWFEVWFSRQTRPTHYGELLARGRQHDPTVAGELSELVGDHQTPAIVRATAVEQLLAIDVSNESRKSALRKAFADADPMVRMAVIPFAETLPRRELLQLVEPLLDDRSRGVRIGAARALLQVPDEALDQRQRDIRDQAIDDYRTGLLDNADQAGSWLALGLLHEQQHDRNAAAQAYRTGLEVQPWVTGPRSNLSALLESWQSEITESTLREVRGNRDEFGRLLAQRLSPVARWGDIATLRADELELLQRDARLAPDNAAVQYRCGLSLYLAGDLEKAERHLRRATEIAPNQPTFLLGLALFQEKMGNDDAVQTARRLVELRPDNPQYRAVLQRLQQTLPP